MSLLKIEAYVSISSDLRENQGCWHRGQVDGEQMLPQCPLLWAAEPPIPVTGCVALNPGYIHPAGLFTHSLVGAAAALPFPLLPKASA